MFDVFIGSCVLGLIVLCHFDHGVVPSGKAGARRRLHMIRLATDPTRATVALSPVTRKHVQPRFNALVNAVIRVSGYSVVLTRVYTRTTLARKTKLSTTGPTFFRQFNHALPTLVFLLVTTNFLSCVAQPTKIRHAPQGPSTRTHATKCCSRTHLLQPDHARGWRALRAFGLTASPCARVAGPRRAAAAAVPTAAAGRRFVGSARLAAPGCAG